MSQILFLLFVLTIVVPFGAFLKSSRKPESFKKALAVNIFSFFAVLIGGTILTFASGVSAAESTSALSGIGSAGAGYFAAALVTGVSCIGAGIAISAAASAAIGALSENENLFGKALIFVALAEGVAIYGLIVSIMILGSI